MFQVHPDTSILVGTTAHSSGSDSRRLSCQEAGAKKGAQLNHRQSPHADRVVLLLLVAVPSHAV